MKPLLTLALVVSLGVNATLAYFALSGSARQSEDAAAQRAAAVAAEEAARATRPAGPAPVDPQTWAALETPDLRDLVARLRAGGFPPDVIRTIVRTLVCDQFAERRRALDPESEKRPFWKSQVTDPKIQAAQQRLYFEQEKVIRELLGADAIEQDALTMATRRVRYGNLAPEKVEAVEAAQRANSDRQMELYAKKGNYSMEDMNALQKQLHDDIAAILTPAELLEYDLRSSNTARSLRRDLLAFNPTEEEFRSVFKLRQAFDDKYGQNYGLSSSEETQRRRDAETQLKADIVSLLGPERGADYTRATDSNYRQTAQLVARLELPPDTTLNLWNIRKEFADRAAALRSGPPPDAAAAAERNQQMLALQQEAIAKVTPLLGSASRLEAYKQYGGNWLTQMVPPPPRPRPAGAK